MSYTNWARRLEIAKLPTVAARRAELSRLKLTNMEPTVEDEGYYRIPITQKDAIGNGRNIVTGYVPVAIWSEGDTIVGVKGVDVEQHDMRSTEIIDQWTWFCAHPITYELYKGVAEEGEEWPDLAMLDGAKITTTDDPDVVEVKFKSTEQKAAVIAAIPAANREVSKTDNAPQDEEPLPLDVQHATAIDNAIAAAIKAVTNEAEAAQAAGSKNRIAELRLAATRIGEGFFKPPYNEYKRLHGIWTPMVARAERKEKELNTEILKFRESERKKAVAAAAEVARLQQIQDEENERAAQRAISRGEPEMSPPVVEAAPALPPAPASVQPTYGTRKIKEVVLKFAVIEDWVKVFTHFQTDPEIRARLEKLATDAIRAGAEVPGATHREGLI